jgi:hypothetical protein
MRLELSTTDFSRAGIMAGALPVWPHLVLRPAQMNLPPRLTNDRTNATCKSEVFDQKPVVMALSHNLPRVSDAQQAGSQEARELDQGNRERRTEAGRGHGRGAYDVTWMWRELGVEDER